MGWVCTGRLGNGPSFQCAEFAMGRDLITILPNRCHFSSLEVGYFACLSFDY